MQILCLGLSHNTAGIAVREKLAFTEDKLLDLYSRFQAKPMLTESVILSTCNRVEFYTAGDDLTFPMLEAVIAHYSGISQEEIASSMYRLVDMQVVAHLFRVASGLDSMVLGEPQILGQVTKAYETAHQAGCSGKMLSRLFQMAVHAGKRIRTETSIGENSTSIPSIAVRQVERLVPDLSTVQIAILGAGEMAELVIDALRKRGTNNFHVISRSLSNAGKIADRYQGEASTMAALQEVLTKADVLITSSSAPHTLISKKMVLAALSSRRERLLVIIDIAVPRDVEPEVGELPNVYLVDIDKLNQNREDAIGSRRQEIPKAEEILKEELSEFKNFMDAQVVVPVITKLREHAEIIRQNELEKTMRRIDGLSDGDRERIEALTHSIVKKLLHQPTVHLLQVSNGLKADLHIETARSLFGLGDKPDQDNGSEEQ